MRFVKEWVGWLWGAWTLMVFAALAVVLAITVGMIVFNTVTGS